MRCRILREFAGIAKISHTIAASFWLVAFVLMGYAHPTDAGVADQISGALHSCGAVVGRFLIQPLSGRRAIVPASDGNHYKSRDGFLLVNGGMVTGHWHYPLSLIVEWLELDSETVSIWAGGRVLSLGEGESHLIDFLSAQGMSAVGVDLAYDAARFPRSWGKNSLVDYMKSHADRITRADARSLPFENESFDAVVSHQLVNNLCRIENTEVIDEAIRVLKKGGEARVFGYSTEELDHFQSYLIRRYGDPIEIRTRRFENNYMTWYFGPERASGWLLVISKRNPSR